MARQAAVILTVLRPSHTFLDSFSVLARPPKLKLDLFALKDNHSYNNR